MAEPWKSENKLLFSKSCQRWLQSQRVDCGADILSDREASSAGLLSPQLHTCPWKPFVYLVYVGSPQWCHQSGRWERGLFDTSTIVAGKKRKENERKKISWTLNRVLLNCTVFVEVTQWALCSETYFVLYEAHSEMGISISEQKMSIVQGLSENRNRK